MPHTAVAECLLPFILWRVIGRNGPCHLPGAAPRQSCGQPTARYTLRGTASAFVAVEGELWTHRLMPGLGGEWGIVLRALWVVGLNMVLGTWCLNSDVEETRTLAEYSIGMQQRMSASTSVQGVVTKDGDMSKSAP